MECDKIREMLLTDYADGRLDGEAAAGVERHLSDCADCRAYAEDVQKTVLEPLRALPRAEPSEDVWQRIQESIETVPWWERIKETFVLPRPVWAAAGFALVVILALAVRPLISARPPEYAARGAVSVEEQADQMEYMAQLVTDNGNDEAVSEGYEDYGESIEAFFLSKL